MVLSQKKFIFTCIFLGILLSFTLILAEIGIRLYHISHKRDGYIWIPDYYLGHVLSPDNKFTYDGDEAHPEFVTEGVTNNRGMLQSRDVTVAKPDNVFRIIFMGDSFTEGMQVNEDQRFVSLIEERLSREPHLKGKTIEVINAGVRGHSPIVHYLRYKNDLRRFNPDLVVLQLFANDVFEDNAYKARSVLDVNDLPVKINEYFLSKYVDNKVQAKDVKGRKSVSIKLHNFLKKYSKLYEYFYVQKVKRYKKDPTHQRMKGEAQFAEGYQFYVVQNHNSPNVFGEPDFRLRGWQQTENYLNAFKKLLKDDGVKFMMFYIPIEAQLDLEKYGENGRMFFGNTQQGTYINERLEEFSQEESVKFLDLLKSFNEHKEKELYLNWDGHLTAAGHKVLAEELFGFVQQGMD